MSVPRRWALAFVNAAGPESGGALAFLKAVTPLLERLPPTVSGWASGRRLEAVLRFALAAATGGGFTAAGGDLAAADFAAGNGSAGSAGAGRGVEAAIRITALLVRKGRFGCFSSFVEEAEKIIDERAGILNALVESASPPEAGFEDRLKAILKRKKNAGDIKLDIRLVPELLAGCRIGIGSEYFDGSLLGRLNGMTRDLAASSGGMG
jgi:hypothetical protein